MSNITITAKKETAKKKELNDGFIVKVNFNKIKEDYQLVVSMDHKEYEISYFGGTESYSQESFSVGIKNKRNRKIYNIEVDLPKGVRLKNYVQSESVSKKIYYILFYKKQEIENYESISNYDFETSVMESSSVNKVEKYIKEAKKRDKQGKVPTVPTEKYVEFRETNDNQGETWYFYVKSSDSNIEDLKKAVDIYMKDCPFDEYSYRDVKKSEVDQNIKRKSNTMYMEEYNIVDCINHLPTSLDVETIGQFLYKGQCFSLK